MCTVTLEYKNSALARRKLAALMATGLFSKVSEAPEEHVHHKPTTQEIEAHRKEMEDFLYASKIMSAKAFAKHL